MRVKKLLKETSINIIILGLTIGVSAQTATSFHRIGSQDEKSQELFPGTHRARPILADYTNDGNMDMFYGGQDLGGAAKNFFAEYVNQDNRWGDQLDGTYANPILNADYSDPEVIRVGDKYYMVCSEFHFMGMPVLESEDMVNWKIIGQIYDKFDFSEYDTMDRYGGGAWAPSLRHHDGKFWMYVCSPNEGLFMSNATNPAGPWSPLLNVKHVGGWEDPCPLWDDNGDAYMGRSQLGGGPIIIHKMKPDGTELLDDGVKVYEGPTAEGTKLFKKDGYYYISIPEGGVSTGWQTVLRSTNIYGPYEKKIVLEKGSTRVNGPHQGSLVDTPNGEWWFYHFQSTNPLGRVTHLQPVRWEDGWPLMGKDIDENGIGEPVKIWQKPNVGKTVAVSAPQTSDDFNSAERAIQWQFNHNPVNENWSLSNRPGYLTLKALKADKLKDSKNMFTQKTMGYEGEVSTEIDCSKFTNGQRAGLFCVGNPYVAIGVNRVDNKNYVYIENNGNVETITELAVNIVNFKIELDANTSMHKFYYGFNDDNYVPCSNSVKISDADWKGTRVGLYSYNTIDASGEADFDWFRYKFDGPGLHISE